MIKITGARRVALPLPSSPSTSVFFPHKDLLPLISCRLSICFSPCFAQELTPDQTAAIGYVEGPIREITYIKMALLGRVENLPMGKTAVFE